jgi:hypothetical protein
MNHYHTLHHEKSMFKIYYSLTHAVFPSYGNKPPIHWIGYDSANKK